MLNDLAQTLQMDAARIVMIGDTVHDIGMAHAAGAASVAVTYGAHDPEALRASAPGAIVDSVPQLADWLARACAVPRALLGVPEAGR
jgi:phosphoglycolate phosphatase